MQRWLVMAFALGACGGGGGSKSVTIVRQASPNPFRESGCKVSVGDVTFDPAVAATDDDKKIFSFALKQELVVARSGLILDGPPTGENVFLLRPTLQTFAPGGDAQLQVDVTDASGGQVLEQIRVTAKASTLRDASAPFGKPLGRYLKSRFCAR